MIAVAAFSKVGGAAEARLSRCLIAMELAEDRALAHADKQHGAAIKATELRGDMIDAFGKRQMHVTSRSVVLQASIDGLSAEELWSLLALGTEAKALEARGAENASEGAANS